MLIKERGALKMTHFGIMQRFLEENIPSNNCKIFVTRLTRASIKLKSMHCVGFPPSRGSFPGVRCRQRTPGKEPLLAGNVSDTNKLFKLE